MDIKLEIPSTGATVLFGPPDPKNNFYQCVIGIVKPISGLIKVGNATFFNPKIKLTANGKAWH